ncbi:MAG: hypothetical protein IAE97_05185 [Chthoniobacterales bacterium]|nr:hypothetical protein [Chthoniobacterales bacterium]
MRPILPIILLPAMLVLAGCDSPKKTALELQGEIAEYTAKPGSEAASRIEQNFARLDEQIAQLRASGHLDEADMWQRERDALQLRYASAAVTGNLQGVKRAAENLGEAFRQAGQAFGEALQSSQPEKD